MNECESNPIADIDDNWPLNWSDTNFSRISFRSGQSVWVHKPYWEMILKSSLFIIIILISLIGNFMIIRVIIKFKKSRHQTNLFICNMAIADLCTTLVCAWAALIDNLFQNYVLGPIFCKTETPTKVLFLIASVFSLTWISCDRLIGIIKPFRNTNKKSFAIAIMTLIWMLALSIASPIYFWREYRTRQWCDYFEIWCKEDTRKIEVYWFLILAFLVYIPLIIMTVSYCAVICKMKRYEQKISTIQNSVKIKHRRKVILMLFIYLITSAICWTPLQVVVFYRFFISKSTDSVKPWNGEVKFWAHVFASLNSAINPIVYGIINESFRHAICLLYPKLSLIVGLHKYSRKKSVPIGRPNLHQSGFTLTANRNKTPANGLDAINGNDIAMNRF